MPVTAAHARGRRASRQTYANGDVVKWVDPVTEGGPEAEHPTPILALTSGSEATTPTTTASGSSATGPVKTTQDDADTAKTIGIIAIIFAVLALIAAGAALASRRRAGSVNPADNVH